MAEIKHRFAHGIDPLLCTLKNQDPELQSNVFLKWGTLFRSYGREAFPDMRETETGEKIIIDYSRLQRITTHCILITGLSYAKM